MTLVLAMTHPGVFLCKRCCEYGFPIVSASIFIALSFIYRLLGSKARSDCSTGRECSYSDGFLVTRTRGVGLYDVGAPAMASLLDDHSHHIQGLLN